MKEISQTTQSLEQVANQLDKALAGQCSQYEIHVSQSQGFNVEVREQAVDTLEHEADKGIGLTVYIDQAKASVSSTDYRPQALSELVQRAIAIAKHTQADDCAGLAEPSALALNYPDLDLYHPWSISISEAIDEAKHCEALAMAQDKRLKNCEAVTLGTQQSHCLYANSHGFTGHYATTKHYLNCCLIAEDKQGMQRDDAHTIARKAEDLQSPQKIAKRAAEKTLARLGTRPIKTQQVPVLFTAEVARSLLGHFIGAISGSALYRKSSFLLDKIGQQIFPTWVTIQEQPYLPLALGSAPFDAEGVKVRDNTFIAEGALQHYALGSYAARKLGLQTTGNAGGVHNVSMSSGKKNFAALVKQLHRGVIVTDVMGQGVNLVNGNYSRGASGFWVEHGEIQHPVQEITLASNLVELFQKLLAVGNDLDTQGNLRTGSWLVDGVMVGGNQ